MRDWPEIPYAAWAETQAHLHLMTQIVGKYRLARTPWMNHSWHATLYVTPRGLTTGTVPDPGGSIVITFDLIDAELLIDAPHDRRAAIPLSPGPISLFYDRFSAALLSVGADPSFHNRPSEMAQNTPFVDDRRMRPYDVDAARRYHRALLSATTVFERFRTRFLGKSSPVHLFWGAFDLAVTRFSGRTAPRHPGGAPNLPDPVTWEAYSHEVSSAGFWPGGGGVAEPMFYSYAYPTPEGFAQVSVEPEGAAFWSAELGEFLLPYEAVRTAADPAATLTAFLSSTYAAAAELGGWNRSALECAEGALGAPRSIFGGRGA